MREESAEQILPGTAGSEVPGAIDVLRLANEPTEARMSPQAIRTVMEHRRALPDFFELSTKDRKQSSPSLSVWVEALTSVEEAWKLVGSVRRRRIVLKLAVDAIRSIRLEAADPAHSGVDVVWEPATIIDNRGNRLPDFRPGAEGHAGITQLDEGTRIQRKDLRAHLARIATVRILSEVELDRIASAT